MRSVAIEQDLAACDCGEQASRGSWLAGRFGGRRHRLLRASVRALPCPVDSRIDSPFESRSREIRL